MPTPAENIAAEPAVGERGLADSVRDLLGGLRALLHDRLQLLALETQQAIQGLAAIAAYGIAMGLLAGGTWLALAGAMVMWLVEHQVSSSTAMLLAAVFNGVGIAGFALAIQRKSRRIGLPATLQSLKPLQADPKTATPPAGERTIP